MAILNQKKAKKITDTCLGAAMVPELHVRVRERLWHAPVLATQGLTVEAV